MCLGKREGAGSHFVLQLIRLAAPLLVEPPGFDLLVVRHNLYIHARIRVRLGLELIMACKQHRSE